MASIRVTDAIAIDESELVESTTRAGGPGGQHVNTTDTAVVLRFDVANSPNLPDDVKIRVARLAGSRITKDGVVVLRSDGSRSQASNRAEVRARLLELIAQATIIPKKRRATKPTRASQQRRVEAKLRRSSVKTGRGKVRD